MLGQLQKIGEPCQSPFNAGFLTHLYLVKTEQVAYVYLPGQLSVSQPLGSIGIKPNAEVTEFLIKPKTATFSESSSQSADGTSYAMQLSISMKGPAVAITNWMHLNSKKRFVIICRDTLGNCYMAGTFDNGVRVSWSRQVASLNLHQLSFSLINWHPIQFIPSVDLEQIFPVRFFDYSFDLSFS